MDQPFIASGMKTKTRMRIQHFLEEDYTRKPATCLIHDEPKKERAEQLNNIVTEYISQAQPVDFTYTYLYVYIIPCSVELSTNYTYSSFPVYKSMHRVWLLSQR